MFYLVGVSYAPAKQLSPKLSKLSIYTLYLFDLPLLQITYNLKQHTKTFNICCILITMCLVSPRNHMTARGLVLECQPQEWEFGSLNPGCIFAVINIISQRHPDITSWVKKDLKLIQSIIYLAGVSISPAKQLLTEVPWPSGCQLL